LRPLAPPSAHSRLNREPRDSRPPRCGSPLPLRPSRGFPSPLHAALLPAAEKKRGNSLIESPLRSLLLPYARAPRGRGPKKIGKASSASPSVRIISVRMLLAYSNSHKLPANFTHEILSYTFSNLRKKSLRSQLTNPNRSLAESPIQPAGHRGAPWAGYGQKTAAPDTSLGTHRNLPQPSPRSGQKTVAPGVSLGIKSRVPSPARTAGARSIERTGGRPSSQRSKPTTELACPILAVILSDRSPPRRTMGVEGPASWNSGEGLDTANPPSPLPTPTPYWLLPTP